MKKIVVTLLIIIVSLGVGIGGTYYYMSSKYSVTIEDDVADVNINSSNVSVTNLDIYSDIVQNNYSKIVDEYLACGDPMSTYLNDSKLVNNDISNSTAYAIVELKYFDNKSSLDESTIKDAIEKLLGPDYEYDPTSFDASNTCSNHVYNSSTKQYDYRETACGCTVGPNYLAKTYISKAELDGDNLNIYIKVLFPNNQNLTSEGYVKYYSDYSRTKEISLDYETSVNGNAYAEPYDTAVNINKGGSYKITMKKLSDDDYYFASSEKID